MNSLKNNIDENIASGFVKEWQQFDRLDIPKYDQIAEPIYPDIANVALVATAIHDFFDAKPIQ